MSYDPQLIFLLFLMIFIYSENSLWGLLAWQPAEVDSIVKFYHLVLGLFSPLIWLVADVLDFLACFGAVLYLFVLQTNLRVETFVGWNIRVFHEFRTFSRKFITWNTPICKFAKVFTRKIPIKQAFTKIYSEFSIAFFKARRSFIHQKVVLIYRALSEFTLFFLKTCCFFFFVVGTIIINYLPVLNLYILIKSKIVEANGKRWRMHLIYIENL